jgi:hypothetical protein
MKKAVIFFVIILLTLFLLCELKATPIQKSIIPAETNWVMHFDVEKFTSTRFGDQLLNNENILGLRSKNAKFYNKYKIDILKDINGVTIYGFGKDEKKVVVCLRGNFDREYLLGLLAEEESHREIQHGKFTIHKWDYHEFGAFADDHLALLSHDETAIKTALDVIAGKKANITASSLMPYLNEIPSNAFFSALAKDISEMVGLDTKVFVFKKTESALYTLTEEKENIHMKLNITVKTLEDAKNMESVIRGLISLATMQMEEIGKDMRLALEKINISTEGKKIRVDLSYPVKELIDILLGRVKFSPFHILTGFDLRP